MCGTLGRAEFLVMGAALGAASLPLPAPATEVEPKSSLALTGGRIYATPDAPPTRGTILVVAGAIAAIGDVSIPAGAQIVDCTDRTITAGFQNSHCHFTDARWSQPGQQGAAQLTAPLQRMLTRYGFTTVVDTGSLLADTAVLRRRIDSGEVLGPRILTAGEPLYPPDGIPYYVKDSIPPEILAQLPAPPRSAADAVALVGGHRAQGADIIKLFTGSYVTRERVLPMPADIARAATAEARRRRVLTFSHESNVAGLEVALDAGVDVLAHAVEDTHGFTSRHLERMLAQKMALTPTLTLYSGDTDFEATLRAAGDFARAGGRVLFGTDVGYLPERFYDPTPEYALMERAGMTWRQILASLTTAPAATFGEGELRGRLVRGLAGDIAVLNGDPARDVRAFGNVQYTIRRGRVIYEAG
jgi:imidazolonepropionase-like amidohydrolase